MLPSGVVGMTSVGGVATGLYGQMFGQHVHSARKHRIPMSLEGSIEQVHSGFNRIAGVLMRQKSCLKFGDVDRNWQAKLKCN